MDGPSGAITRLEGRQCLYFAGTAYLGLQAHPEVLQAAADACGRFGIHTATSRGSFGNSPPILEVEQRAAAFLGTEAAIYLVSGYAVNFACCAALSHSIDVVLVDEAAHDCVRESIRWFDTLKRPPIVFRHCEPAHVKETLHREMRPGWRGLILTDGVFAVSGHLAPLADYLAILARYEASAVLVDDAHGLAVLGEQGRGSLELAGVRPDQINRMAPDLVSGPPAFHTGTLSKAVGGHGGLIAGDRAFIDQVCNSSGWFRGASAPATPVAAATAKALEIVQTRPELRRQLAANVLAVRQGLRSLGLPVEESPVPIIGLVLDSAQTMKLVQQRLWAEEIAVAYTCDYAGAGPLGMLRIAVFATHTPDMIDRLIDAMRRAI